MDLNNYWQENKRFVVSVASGAIVFAVGSMLIGSFFRAELTKQRRAADATARKLRTESMYTQSDLSTAQKERDELAASVDVLRGAVAFAPRKDFVLDPARGAASNQYFGAVSRVREELLTLAGRANLRLPEDLGLPALSPTREGEIARYLEALDLVDRAARMALRSGVQRIDKIDIKLDPGLTSRQGVGQIESTRVEFTLSGRPTPLVRFLEETQSPRPDSTTGSTTGPTTGPTTGQPSGPLLIEKAQMQPARTKADEVGLEVTFVVARVQAS